MWVGNRVSMLWVCYTDAILCCSFLCEQRQSLYCTVFFVQKYSEISGIVHFKTVVQSVGEIMLRRS